METVDQKKPAAENAADESEAGTDFARWQTPSGRKPHLSASQLTKLMTCGEAWRLSYVEGLRFPGTHRLAVGLAVHEVIAANLRKKSALHEGAGIPLQDIPDITRDIVEQHLERHPHPDKSVSSLNELEEHREAAIEKAIGLSMLHAMFVAPMIDAIEVEQRGRIELKGFPFDIVVVKDIVTDDAIRDTKTTAAAPKANAAAKSFQLALYALHDESMGRPPKRLVLDYLVATPAFRIDKDAKFSLTDWLRKKIGAKKTNLYYKPVETKPTPEMRTLVLNLVERAAVTIEKGAFMPNPDSWLCPGCEFGREGVCKYWVGR